MTGFPLDKIHSIVCHECKPLHAPIVERMFELLDHEDTRKTHLFNGRYENIYVSPELLPQIEPILNTIREEAARLLKRNKDELTIGYWFNLMRQGDVTLPHNHDDLDELLSGTYYLQMPENSGKLSIKLHQQEAVCVEPIEATLVFFNPQLEHEVSAHQSSKARVSIGFNIGSRHD